MGEAAQEDAKQRGELIQQRLRKLVNVGIAVSGDAVYKPEFSLLSEAADLLDWYERERDSLITEVRTLEEKRVELNAEIGERDAKIDRFKRDAHRHIWINSYIDDQFHGTDSVTYRNRYAEAQKEYKLRFPID